MKTIGRELWNLLLIAAGIFSAGMGLKAFLLSSNFIDGGVTGISMLLAKTTRLPPCSRRFTIQMSRAICCSRQCSA